MPVHATTDEILGAFQALSDDELLALSLYARRQIHHTPFTEPLDLVHEALHRSLEGRRNWPLHVDFGVYMAMTMRSIADAERKSASGRSLSWDAMDERRQSGAASWRHAPSAEDEAIAIEEFRIAHKAADIARAALGSDHDAAKVLNGLLAGMSPKEMCAGYGMASNTFEAARQRVMRRLRASAATLH